MVFKVLNFHSYPQTFLLFSIIKGLNANYTEIIACFFFI